MELEQLEALVLTADLAQRDAALAQLIPGTEDDYFYRCLEHLHRGELEQTEPLLRAWVERHGETARVHEIRDRRALLAHDSDPAASREHIRRRLDLRFDHQRETDAATRELPSRLDQALIGREPFRRDAFSHHHNLDGFSDRALPWLAQTSLNLPRLRALLGRLRHPEIPGLVELISRELDDRQSAGFGGMAVHPLLTRAQLDALLAARPTLLTQPRFVEVYLERLLPGPDVDLEADPAALQDHLARLWAFVEPLPPTFNSLEVHVLYHHLDLARRSGRYDQALLRRYLQLPRNAAYVEAEFSRHHRDRLANLQQDFRPFTGLAPVGDDQALIRDYLEVLFADPEVDDYREFRDVLDNDYLTRVFAESKLLAGIGDRERWYTLLDDPSGYAALEQRVDIDFCPDNPRVLASDDDGPVRLKVAIKNVPVLVLKVFEIDALAYFRAHGRAPGTDVDLDGLVANDEQVFEYDAPALHRIRRSFELESLRRPGIYVVELIGAGKSSRALLRKGSLRVVERLGAAGHALTVLDEGGRPAADAVVHIGDRELRADPRGEVRIPYAPSPQRTQLLLRRGRVASVVAFTHQRERYDLEAGFHVAREQLIAGASAQLLVHAVLRVNGVEVSPKLLQAPTLTITAVDHGGVRSSVSAEVEVRDDGEIVHEFAVPEGLRTLQFRLQAKVRSLSEQRELELGRSGSLEVNAIDQQAEIADLHLSPTAEGYVLHALGKSGEARAGLAIGFGFAHLDFRARMTCSLQTDARGRIELGALADISLVEAALPGGVSRSWSLLRPELRRPQRLHGAAGHELRLPAPATVLAAGTVAALLERRGRGYLRSRLDAVHVEDGSLCLRGLEPGSYELVLEAGDPPIQIDIGPEVLAAGWSLSPRRQLQLRHPEALRLRSLTRDGQTLQIHLGGATDRTRVHVFAGRFLDARDPRADLDLPGPEPIAAPFRVSRSLYLSGRDIGDEYRYILERRRAQIFAGNMAERPGLLLNPWALRTTSTAIDQARDGGAYGAMADEAYAGAAAPASAQAAHGDAGLSSNLDFLPTPAFVALGLRPDADGRVSLDADLAGFCFVEVVAVDAEAVVSRRLPLPEVALAPRDLRLRDGLDPRAHVVRRKRHCGLATGEVLTIDEPHTAKLEAVDTVAKAHALLLAAGDDATLREFAFVTRWPALDPDEQRRLYSKYACHELHLFLARKDPAFFTAVVRPYLANKLHPTFLDHYLLEADLRPYLEPWAYGRLNVLERILLAQRVAGEAGPGARHIGDRFDLLPPDPAGDDAAFAVVLGGSALAPPSAGAAMTFIGASRGGGGAPGAPPALGRAGPPPSPRAPAAPAPARARKRSALREESAKEAKLEAMFDAQGEGGEFDLAAREEVRGFYRPKDKTQEWAENNYYRRPIAEQGPTLIDVNGFWRDYAAHVGPGPFLSGNFIHASNSFAEMLCALAVLDLPFVAEAPTIEQVDGRAQLRANAPMLVFQRQLTAVEAADDPARALLVSQTYLRADDRYRYDGHERHEKPVSDEFLVHTVYVCQVVLTNPTASSHALQLLLQIPEGAIALAGHRPLHDLPLQLGPRQTYAHEYAFYFPAPGRFAHFPVQVSKNEALVAWAEPTTLEVLAAARTVDTGSWSHVSQHGDAQAVLAYLEANNIERLDLARIAWRMRDRGVFQQTLALLSRRHVYSDLLWSYALHHGDAEAIAVYLRHQDRFLRGCGLALDAALVGSEPVARRWYQHLEYAPLVNARAHTLGAKRKILNDALAQQYRAFLEALAYQRGPDDDQLLAAIYHALLQDRIADALDLLARVDPERVGPRLQFDYLRAYLALHRGDLEQARALAAPHREHGVDRWRARFANLLAIVAEAEGATAVVVDADDRDQEQARLAASEPALDFEIEAGALTIHYQNLAACTLNCYRMDIELLFSRQPFSFDRAERFAVVAPNHSQTLALPAGQTRARVELPADYRRANAVIELVAGGLRRSRANDAHNLSVRVIEAYGQLRVHDRDDMRPLPRVYVKVYARFDDGAVRFYKDGYTDVRGAFDYASLSTDELERVERFALLIVPPTGGGTSVTAGPPV